MKPRTLNEAVEIFQSKQPLQDIYGLEFEPGDQQRALIAYTLRNIAEGKREHMFPGAAGTGKTTTLEVLLKVLEDCGKVCTLSAPTWKAAGRAEETTGRSVVTIHSIVYAGAEEVREEDDEFASELDFNRRQPGTAPVGNILIVDEASMVSEAMAQEMYQAIPDRTQVIAVGDPHQLPPVKAEAGFDLASAEITLSDVYRQEDGSPVLRSATQIREQEAQFNYSFMDPRVHYSGQNILNACGVPLHYTSPDEASARFVDMIRRTDGDAQCITGTHKSRVMLNDKVRTLLGFKHRSKGPSVGEKLIARATQGGMRNSDICVVRKVTPINFGETLGTGWILIVDSNGFSKEVAILKSSWMESQAKHRGQVANSTRTTIEKEAVLEAKSLLKSDFNETVRKRINEYEVRVKKEASKWMSSLIRSEVAIEYKAYATYLKGKLVALDSAYAITCHASQGSQWTEVMIIADVLDFMQSREQRRNNDTTGLYRWGYTALTRTISHAVVIGKAKESGW